MLQSLDRLAQPAHTLAPKRPPNSSPATQLLSPTPIPHSSPTTTQSHAPKPPRHKRPPSPPIRIPIQPGHCLVFGRKPDIPSLASEIAPKTAILPITLPKSFTHASRTHCLCTLIAPPLGGLNIRIVVKGQNGLMVDGERFEEGSSAGVELERRDGEQIELGFYGGKKVECYVKIDDHSLQRARARPNALPSSTSPKHPPTTTTTTTTTTTNRAGKRKLPGSSNSPLIAASKQQQQPLPCKPDPSPSSSPSSSSSPATSAAVEDTSKLPPDRPIISPPPAKKLCLSPIPSPPYDRQTTDGLPPTGEERERGVRGVMEAMDLDLLGLIASAVVFSSRATVSTTELIRAVLDTQPSLAEAVLGLLPEPLDSRDSPRPPPPLNHSIADELALGRKKERECLSAPLPSLYPSPDEPPPDDTKPFAFKPSPVRYPASEAGPSDRSPAPDFVAPASDFKTDRIVLACRPVILETLRAHWRPDGSGMFGCVSNDGLKDASGEPLEALWYYQPQHDSDDERRLNLQPYVRHVRHTQTVSKQYYFKKVRGSGRRKS
ncbi:hypothetical protein PtA15_1A896 [Puccinia triticina]|uniref:FHA domain-containing protein n=1 Tax=Puccinia triticina TaxID=208348 RepID=A0ABY7C8S6_9BASI|nr:uncharacterized protein PtA15_1A896 [Puccinia triticina]WAQ81554.1 hypothetical protein PtA15_1A896 [Puccinia triticina]WAR52439.1 hypothetical protein PtB15_1B881 [Puccinia triticina]